MTTLHMKKYIFERCFVEVRFIANIYVVTSCPVQHTRLLSVFAFTIRNMISKIYSLLYSRY